MNSTPIANVLTIRHFRRLWVSQIASQFAANVLLFLLALVLYQRTQSNAMVSGLFLAYGLPSLFLGMIAGVIVDRLDRRSVLLVCHGLRICLIVLLMLFHETLFALYGIVFFSAIITQFTTPSEVPLIPRYVNASQLVTANSLFSMSFFSAMAIGFISAGPLLRIAGTYGAYSAIMALFFIAFASVFGLPLESEGINTFQRIKGYSISYLLGRIKQNLTNGMLYVKKSKALIDALLLLTCTQITLILLGSLGPGFADTLLQIDVRDASPFVVAPVIFGILVGAMWVGQIGYKIFSIKALTTIGVYAAGAILIIISLLFIFAKYQHGILPIAFALLFLLGIANSFLDVPANSILQKETSEDMRGRVYGLLSAIVGGIGMMPVVISGILADIVGVQNVILLLGCTIFIAGFVRAKNAII